MVSLVFIHATLICVGYFHYQFICKFYQEENNASRNFEKFSYNSKKSIKNIKKKPIYKKAYYLCRYSKHIQYVLQCKIIVKADLNKTDWKINE